MEQRGCTDFVSRALVNERLTTKVLRSSARRITCIGWRCLSFFLMRLRTVLISGAGIAGPTLAFWLKAAGFEPTLIEQSASQMGARESGGQLRDRFRVDISR